MLIRIATLPEKKLVGNRIKMSFTQNKTGELWRSFMPRRNQISNPVNSHLYSVEVYPAQFFDPFDPSALFEKWAAMEVVDFENIPMEMETITIPSGLYAVFLHKGPASAGSITYSYIFETWLQNASYLLDHRPHFALMGEKYKHEDPSSEEEIWIPIRPK
jgi:AraC family transcriptional regulator